MLREYRSSDLEHINDFTQHEEITRYLSDIFVVPQSLEQSRTFLQGVMAGMPNGIFYVIADLEGEYLGQIDVSAIDWARGIGTLGIVIANPKNLGRGLGRQAVTLLLTYGFRRMGLRKIELAVHDFNERAIRCYKACGFIEEGRLRGHALRDGVWHDTVRMGVFAPEFFSRPSLEN
jgi:RimJ/RimL family protein N-acetyltransferase